MSAVLERKEQLKINVAALGMKNVVLVEAAVQVTGAVPKVLPVILMEDVIDGDEIVITVRIQRKLNKEVEYNKQKHIINT